MNNQDGRFQGRSGGKKLNNRASANPGKGNGKSEGNHRHNINLYGAKTSGSAASHNSTTSGSGGRPPGDGYHNDYYNQPPAPPRRPRKRSSAGSLLLSVIILALLIGLLLWFNNRNSSSGSSSIETVQFRVDATPPASEMPFEAVALDASLEVHVLDVGQGLSVLLTTDNCAMLYDGGDRGTSSFVVAYLKQQGIEKLDYVVVSHYDADHLAGVIGALNVFEVETLIAPDYKAATKLFASFEQIVQEKALTVTSPTPGDTYTFGEGEFQILSPIGNDYEDENEYSIVLRISLGDSSLLLTGDATMDSEEELLKGNMQLQSNVLLVSHHGSSGSTSSDFLDAVSPNYAIISCGRDNSYGHPAARVMELLETKSIPLYRTDLQSTVKFTMTPENITFEQEPCNDYTSGSELYGLLCLPRALLCPSSQKNNLAFVA